MIVKKVAGIFMNKVIKNVSFYGVLTGEHGFTDTRKFDVNGTDLGIPVYSKKEDSLWLFFGDTFSTPLPSDENWRGTVIGKISNFDFSKGIFIDDFVLDDQNKALGLIKHHKCKNEEEFEVTKIAQGAVEVDGAMYVFYESIRRWGERGFWDVNYSGAVKSSDGGKTWKRIYDLSWVCDIDKYYDVVKQLVEEDENFKPSGESVDLEKHFCPAFGQIYPFEGKDGYIYITGRRGGRQFGATLGRVKKEDIENFNEYEYYVNKNGNRIWIKGSEGLKAINENEEDSYVVEKPTSNFTVGYNNYLNKYLCIYFKPHYGVVLRKSEYPWGPFNEEEMIVKIDDEMLPFNRTALYGGFTHELLSSDGGKTIYVIVSQWNELFYGSEVIKVELKK